MADLFAASGAEWIRQPAGLVASYACDCGARDEVREPAPLVVDCWSCRLSLGGKRWGGHLDTPPQSARHCTPSELARLD